MRFPRGLLLLLLAPALRAGDLTGHYVVAVKPTIPSQSPPASTPSPAPQNNPATGPSSISPSPVASALPSPGVGLESYGGTMDILPHRNAYSVTWQLTQRTRPLHGLALLEDNDLLGVSLATGGAAYGVAIYHHIPADHEWHGRWISSIDGAGIVGDIRFDDRQGAELPGHHRLVSHRPGVGGFEGSVDIVQKGDSYLLAFSTGRSVLYRGLGILADDGRLVVGWSFGSTPALAFYKISPEGLLTGRRVSLHSGQPVVTNERLAHDGEDAARLLPVAAHSDDADEPPLPGAAGTIADPALATLEPNPPVVKNRVYEDLVEQYGASGWADRLLAGQLTPDERDLLAAARQRLLDAKARGESPGPRRTIGELIEDEHRQQARATPPPQSGGG